MWESLYSFPRGSLSTRNFVMFFAAVIVASFGYLLAASTPVAAAVATWQGDAIVYEGDTYTSAQLPPSLQNSQPGAQGYEFVSNGTGTNKNVAFIYFPSGVAPKSAGEATYILYTLNPPNTYTNARGENKITLTPVDPLQGADTQDGALQDTCTIDAIGWMVCPLMNGIAEGMDFIYERIRSFLVVKPITTDVNNPIYRIWVYSRDLANIAFIIGFLVIIYSYLVGGGFSGYEIRKILPRLVMAAILINISYIICAAAVDVSNIAGYGVNALFESVRDEVMPGSQVGETNWTSVTTFVLAGGTGTVAGGILLTGAIAGSTVGLWFLLAPFLLGAALLVIVTFIILAARQAIIVILIAIAPLAFAAFILPNTEKWFEKWRSLFFTMLIMFPAFGAVFGGAQLAGEVIIRTASTIEQVILGLGVMVAPLAITPLLLKLGGGLLNRFGGIVNNPQKGILDRYKNYNRDRLGEHVAKNNAANAKQLRDGTFKRKRVPFTNKTVPGNLLRRSAARSYAKGNFRESQKKLDEERAQNEWQGQTQRFGGDNSQNRGEVKNRFTGRAKDGYGNLDTYKRDNQLFHGQHEAHNEERWQNLLNTDARRGGIQTDTRMAEGRSKVVSGAMEAQDERTFQTTLNTDAGYANLRAMKVQTTVDSGVSEMQKAAIEATGKVALSTEVAGDRDLRVMKVRTYADEKTSETIDNTLKKNAEANWNNLSKNNVNVQELRLREVQATDQAKVTDERFNKVVADIKANGTDARGVAAQSFGVAQSIQTLGTQVTHEEKAVGALNTTAQSNAERLYIESSEGRNLSVRSQAAQDVLESAKVRESAIVQEWRTEEGAKGLTGNNAVLAEVLRQADTTKRVQTQRTGAAKRVGDVEYAKQVQIDATGLAVEAGGIEGEAGVSQAKAVAFQTIVKAFNDGVAAEKTLFSRTKEDVLLSEQDAQGNLFLGSPDVLDLPSEKIAAMGGSIASRMHQMSHIKLWRRMGELQQQATNELTLATASGDQDAINMAEEKIGKVKDLQQQVVGDKKKTPFGLTDRDQGDANVGQYSSNIYEMTRSRIITNMSGQRLAEMDPDDLRLIFEMAQSGKLNQDQLDRVTAAYEAWENDDNLNSRIESKHRNLLEPIRNYTLSNNPADMPQPGTPPPQGMDNPNFWDKVYDDLDSQLSDPS